MTSASQAVLVLGATGAVGCGVVDFLTRDNSLEVVAASRDTARAVALQQAYGCKTTVVDIIQSAHLAEVMAEYRWVVQAAGPAHLIADRVRSLTRTHQVVVDVSGPPGELDGPSADGCYLWSGGVYPGLTEIWADHVIRSHLDTCWRVETHLAGNAGFTATGNLDVLISLDDPRNHAMATLAGNQMVPAGLRTVNLPHPAGMRKAMPVVHPGLRVLARIHDLTEAAYHNTFANAEALSRFMSLRSRVADGQNLEVLAREMSEEDPPAVDGGWCMVFSSAHGIKSGSPVRVDGAILLPTDWNRASGWVSGAALACLLSDPAIAVQADTVVEAVPSSQIIAALSTCGVRHRITVKDLA